MDYIIKIFPQILDGLGITFGTFAVTLVLSLPLGALISLGRVSKNKVVSGLLGIYTWVLRGTPLLLQMFLIFFGLPAIGIQLFGRMRLPYVYLAFVLNYAAYFAEIFRSGIQSVERGQLEAARLLGYKGWQLNLKIVLPQVIKRTLPSIGNEIITLVKDTSLVYALGLAEIFKIAAEYFHKGCYNYTIYCCRHYLSYNYGSHYEAFEHGRKESLLRGVVEDAFKS